jgi:chaperonin GroES
MRVRVRNDLVFIRPEEQPTVSEGGIHMVYDRQRSTVRGVVVALGDGPMTAKGVRLPHVCEVGDRVIFSPDTGEEIIFERENLIAMREHDILGIVVEQEQK